MQEQFQVNKKDFYSLNGGIDSCLIFLADLYAEHGIDSIHHVLSEITKSGVLAMHAEVLLAGLHQFNVREFGRAVDALQKSCVKVSLTQERRKIASERLANAKTSWDAAAAELRSISQNLAPKIEAIEDQRETHLFPRLRTVIRPYRPGFFLNSPEDVKAQRIGFDSAVSRFRLLYEKSYLFPNEGEIPKWSEFERKLQEFNLAQEHIEELMQHQAEMDRDNEKSWAEYSTLRRNFVTRFLKTLSEQVLFALFHIVRSSLAHAMESTSASGA